jgi:hypothetical protein
MVLTIRCDVYGAHGEDADVVVRVALDRSGVKRAASLAGRIATIVSTEDDLGMTTAQIGEVARAFQEMERLLVDDPGDEIRLGQFLDRFLTLRAVVASRGEYRMCAADLAVDFPLARAVAYILCDLIDVAEHMGVGDGPDARIAVEPDDGNLIIAMCVAGMSGGPVPSMAGLNALKRAEGLVHSIGGSFARGIREGEMLFGIGLPVADV